jgi:hypothetical protein
MEQSQLLAHCGSSKITREELKVIRRPQGAQPINPFHTSRLSGRWSKRLASDRSRW